MKRCVVILAIVALILAFFPVSAFAANHSLANGEFDLSGCVSGDTVTIEAGASVTLTGSAPANVAVICGDGVNLTMNGVSIDNSANNNVCALSFTGSGNTLTLVNTSTLISGRNEPGVRVEDGTCLQISGDGTLNTTGGFFGAGIGGGNGSFCGTIDITTGTVNAYGNNGGAGIGNGRRAANGGRITISGGTVTATGGRSGAGIGGGRRCGTDAITISGGAVTAIGGSSSAGIGSGRRSSSLGEITISGGIVTATGGDYYATDGAGGAGIGGGEVADGEATSGGKITISGGTVTANGGTGYSGVGGGAGIGIGGTQQNNTQDADVGSITISGGVVTANGAKWGAGIGSGGVGDGNTGTITGGSIEIKNGTVKAKGGDGAAGIGGGRAATNGGVITILGGDVEANGGNGAAGIGGGCQCNGGTINIEGGMVKAKGAAHGAGIGSGHNSTNGGTITISGGKVYAARGTQCINDIGDGVNDDSSFTANGTLTISGTAAVFLKNDVCITPTLPVPHVHKTPSDAENPMIFVDNAVYGISVNTGWTDALGGYFVLLTLSYDVNDGSGTVPASVEDRAAGTTTTVGDESGISRTDYVFSSWNTAADGSGTAYAAGETFTFKADTTLYAQWSPLYTLSYDVNGGSGTVPASVEDCEAGTTTTVGDDSGISRDKYAFSGWNTAADGSGTAYAAGDVFTFTADTTLYAQWTALYSLSYDANGGSGAPSSSTHATGSTVTISSVEPTRTGYTFDGWISNITGDITVYKTGTGDNSFDMLSYDVILTAKWTAKQYTVMLNDGMGGITSIKATYHEEMTDAGKLEREGYTFRGYYTGADGGGDQYYNEDMSSVMDWDIASDTTLYAYWTADPHEFTYTYPDGTTSTETRDTGETFNISDGTGFEKGYNIAGWVIEGVFYELGAEYKMPTYGVTAQPVWTENIQTITYSSSGGSGSANEEQQASRTFALHDGIGFAREGYVIEGWAIEGTVYMLGELYEMPTYSVTADAIWEVDSDNDGVSDYDEINAGTDPNNPDEIPLIGDIIITVLDADYVGIEDMECVLNSIPKVSFSDENGSITYSGVYLFPHTLSLREGNAIELARFGLGFVETGTNSVTIDDSGTSAYSTVAGSFQTIHIIIQQIGDSWEIIDATIEVQAETTSIVKPDQIQSSDDAQVVVATDTSDDDEQVEEGGSKVVEVLMICMMIISIAVAVGFAISIISDIGVLRWYNSLRKKNLRSIGK